MACEANRRAELAEEVLGPRAAVPRGSDALPAVVADALCKKQPARALVEQPLAQPLDGLVPVGASIA